MKASSGNQSGNSGPGTTAARRRKRNARRAASAAAVLVGGALLATACGSVDGATSGESKAAPGATSASPTPSSSAAGSAAHAADDAAHRASDARITISPKDRASNVGLNHDAKVTVASGTLTKVTLVKQSGGAPVSGRISADGHSWQPDGALARSTAYTVTATAKDAQNRQAVSHAAFSTVSPAGSFVGYYTPENNSTVGVGMPVSINFNKAITHKADVQSHITVSSTSGQRVVGHWFGAKRIDFRPADYWKAGSTVTLKLRLDHVTGANGVTGVQDRTVRFHVGRAQVSTVDVATQMMTVTRDGQVVRTIPVSTGTPQHPTYNGQMVISEKFTKTRMNGDTVGFGGEYNIPDVPHAMRLSTSGTFIHGNYWSAGSVFGASPTSHGCIGIRDVRGAGDPTTDAAWFYANSLTGDVVTVQNSPDHTIAPDNGLNGWNMSWSQWIAGSATGDGTGGASGGASGGGIAG
ncbi:L,D-transpeptidase [Streptantibioticus silvisoli]|uniref:L,D-transpeptidase n=1 Tax=Streptantibioticus silvisoli TaxID=2705255 RepID=UPI003F6C26C3